MKHQAGRNPTGGDAGRLFLKTTVAAPFFLAACASTSIWNAGGPGRLGARPGRRPGLSTRDDQARRLVHRGSGGKCLARDLPGSEGKRNGVRGQRGPGLETLQTRHLSGRFRGCIGSRRGEEGAKVEAAEARWLPIRSSSARSPAPVGARLYAGSRKPPASAAHWTLAGAVTDR